MPVIFLSYRRNDSQDVTGRIYDRLTLTQRDAFPFAAVQTYRRIN